MNHPFLEKKFFFSDQSHYRNKYTVYEYYRGNNQTILAKVKWQLKLYSQMHLHLLVAKN